MQGWSYGPEVRARHSHDGSWEGDETNLEGTESLSVHWVDVEVAHHAKDTVTLVSTLCLEKDV